jgi:hypothetical protein
MLKMPEIGEVSTLLAKTRVSRRRLLYGSQTMIGRAKVNSGGAPPFSAKIWRRNRWHG